jgi:poly(A) polymerase
VTSEERTRAGAVEVARRLRGEGYEAWFAGGCVRDLLLGGTPKDWDIATDARPEAVQALFPKTVAVGAAFGVVQVLMGRGRAYEVATFRADGSYLDGRRPASVAYSSSREADVERRDFTINALLMDPESAEVLDYVGGQADLRAGVIRAVGDPARRFEEDRLRMLRAVRFAARLGFTIEPETWAALTTRAGRLEAVSPERITQELEGLLLGPRPGHGLRLLERSGLAEACLPEARPAHLAEACDRLPEATRELDAEARAAVAWALVHAAYAAPEVEPRLRDRRLSRARLRAVQDLLDTAARVRDAEAPARAPVLKRVHGAAAPQRRAFLYALGGPGADLVERWDEAARFLEAHPPAPEAFLSGADLKALGISPGPHFKRILEAVEAAALEGRVKRREAALALAREVAERG